MKHLLTLSLASLALTLSTPLVQAQQGPERISYQGRLTNSSGTPVGSTTPENRNIVFRIFDHPTTGARKWTEKHTATVLNGDFSVILGAGVDFSPQENRPILSSILDGPERYIEISVEETPGVYQVISPRQQITASAFALRANVAQSVNQASGESTFNTTTTNGNAYMNGTLVMNGANQIYLGGGGGDANGALFSNSGGVSLLGRGPTDAQRTVFVEAKGGTNFSGPINFGSRVGQHINLWGDTFGLGIEPNVQYYRSAGTHRWYLGGNSGGGGTIGAELNTGGFTLNSGVFTGNLNGSVIRGNNHGLFAQSFGSHAFGSQDNTTYSRSPQYFAWYVGGNHNNGLLNGGGGTRVATLGTGGLDVNSGNLSVSGNSNINGSANVGGGVTANGALNIGGAGRVNGDFTVGGDILRVGGNRVGQEGSSGILAFGLFGFSGVSLVGGGQFANSGAELGNNLDRKIKFWNEGGAYFTGGIRVENNNGANVGAYRWYNFNSNSTSGAGYLSNISFIGPGRVIGAEFNATSDARIKKVKGRSDTGEDLKTLLGLRITDYTKVEDMDRQPREYKKVIAQELEEVFPQAVSKIPGSVPDIFRKFTAQDGFVPVGQALAHPVRTGDILKIYPEPVEKAGGKEPGSEEVKATVTEVTKDGFRLNQNLSGNLFIYGREVKDLRVVDYEAISMLNVSATQELHRTIEKQAAELKALQEENAALKAELAQAQASNEGQDKRLAAIEKALAGSQGVTVGTAALKATPASSRRAK